MLHKGPIPRAVHGLLEYLAGALLIAAPFLWDFDAGSGKAAAIIGGLVLLILAAITEGPTGIVDQLGVQAHAVLDLVVAGLLVAAPFLFGFSDDGEPTALFVLLGIAHLLVSIGTRYVRAR